MERQGGKGEWSRGRGTKGEGNGGNKNKRKCRSFKKSIGEKHIKKEGLK